MYLFAFPLFTNNQKGMVLFMKKLKAIPRRTEFTEIPDCTMAKVTESNHAMDIVTFEYQPIPPTYRKVSKDEWEDTKTQKRIKAKRENGTLIRSTESLAKTFKRIDKTIRHNFFGEQSEVFITLKFDKKITDTKILSTEFDNFWDKLQRDCNTGRSYAPPYRALVKIEPTGRDEYHIHCLLKRLDGKRLFIPYEVLNKLWTNGGTHIEDLYYAEGLAKYLDSLRVKKKKATLKYYKCNLKISRKYGQFEKVTKSDMEHGEAIKRAEEKGLSRQSNYAFDIMQPLPEPDCGDVRINTVSVEHYSIAKRRYKHHKIIDTH